MEERTGQGTRNLEPVEVQTLHCRFQGSWGQPFSKEFSDGSNKSSTTGGRPEYLGTSQALVTN